MPQAFRLFPAAFVVMLLLSPLAFAADPAVDKAEVTHLIAAIQDPQSRDHLVEQLKLLEGADKAAEPPEEPGLLSLVSDKLQDLADELLATLSSLSDLGRLVEWLQAQIADPHLRSTWAEMLGKLALIFGGGVAMERLLQLGLRIPRNPLAAHRPGNRWLRLPLGFGLWLMDLLPIAVFVFTAHALRSIGALTLAGDALQATILVNTAYALTRLTLVTVQALITPDNSAIRLAPLDDETASYLTIWARRLTLTGVWGYFAIQAFRLLGMPKTATGFSLKVLGLVVTTLLVILVLQNRQAVASWIRSQGEAEGFSGKLQGIRNRLAEIWHILACLYIVGAFAIWAFQVQGGFEYVLQGSALTVLILAFANLAANALAGLVERSFAISEELRREFPQLEARANRYLAVMHSVVRVIVALAALFFMLQAWGLHALSWLGSELGRRLISSTLMIAAVLVGALILWELVSAAIARYLAQTDGDGNVVERSARARTLLPLLRNVLMVFLVVVVGMIVLSELGVNIAPLLAGAGVLGVAIGFGSQKLVQDVITGAFILFEDTMAVGDVVKIGEHGGTVEGMTIRTLRLRDANGQIHTLPFSSVATVINMSRDFAYYMFDIGVSYREDVDQVMGVMKQLGAEMRQDPEWAASITEDVEVFGLDKFEASAVVIRGRLKTPPGKQWAAGREFNRRLKNRFDQLGIELPYPSTTLYFGQGKDGQASAANIRIVERKEPQRPTLDAPPPFTGDPVEYPVAGEVG